MSPPVTPSPKPDPDSNPSSTNTAADLGQHALPSRPSAGEPLNEQPGAGAGETGAGEAAVDQLLREAGGFLRERWAAKRAADQSAAPPVDEELLRAAVRDQLGPEEKRRVHDLVDAYQIWEDAHRVALREYVQTLDQD